MKCYYPCPSTSDPVLTESDHRGGVSQISYLSSRLCLLESGAIRPASELVEYTSFFRLDAR